MHQYRTYDCGKIAPTNVGEQVRLSGWVSRRRDHGGVLFVDLRDHYGVTQCVFRPHLPFFEAVERLTYESVVTVTGQVVLRSEETINPNLKTGKVELVVENLSVQSEADQIPFPIGDEYEEAGESHRMRYRFLDLRRSKMQSNIKMRAAVIKKMRECMEDQGFLEVQTPILTASSPEGARDFLVPSRLHPGKFYALPQAPQIYKQILMVSGFDKYYQIAPCFRDEDARADRAPGEFYQLDLEMAFVEQQDVLKAVEQVIGPVFQDFAPFPSTPAPFPHISYKDALNIYGSDKPDLRNPLKIKDLTESFRNSSFKIFANTVQKGGTVRAIPVSNVADRPRSFFDKLNSWAQERGAPGLGYIVYADTLKGPIAKVLTEDEQKDIVQKCEMQQGDAVFFVCSENIKYAQNFAGEARNAIAEAAGCVKKDSFEICWVTEFPLFEKDDKTGALHFSHNPFSRPLCSVDEIDSIDPLSIQSEQYDLVCNGIEIGSGAIRNHNPELLKKIFMLAGHTKEQVEKDFAGMLNAFAYGPPPHGGCAPGVDRIIMLLAQEENIREVVAFPKNQLAVDLLLQAPSFVEKHQLDTVHLKTKQREGDTNAE